MRILWAVLLCASGVTGPASGATVEKVSKDGKSVTLKVSPEEATSLKVGDKVTVEVGEKEAPLVAVVKSIKGDRAILSVSEHKSTPQTAMRRGSNVNVAAAGLVPMSVTPPPPSIEPDQEAPSPTNSYQQAMNHHAFVSPAQLHQLNGPRTDAALGYSTLNMRASAGGATVKMSVSGPALDVAAATRLTGRRVRPAFNVSHRSFEGRVRYPNANEKVELSETSFAPMVAFDATPKVSAGLAYRITQHRYDGDFYASSHSLSYAQAVPGVTYHEPHFEAGMTFTPRVDEESRVREGGTTSTLHVREGAVVTMHAAGRVSHGMSAFGVAALNQNRMRNVDGEDEWKNNVALLGGASKALDAEMTVDGALSIYTPAHARESAKGPENILRVGLLLGMDKRATEKLKVGAGLSYDRASDDFKDDGEKVKIDRDSLTITARGMLSL